MDVKSWLEEELKEEKEFLFLQLQDQRNNEYMIHSKGVTIT